MPAEILITGPTPPAGRKWCFVCAYTWKAAVIDRFAEQIKFAEDQPDGAVVTIDAETAENLPPLCVVVANGLYLPLQQFGPLEVCWTHLNAIQLKTASGLALPVPGMPMGPGMNGMGGFPR